MRTAVSFAPSIVAIVVLTSIGGVGSATSPETSDQLTVQELPLAGKVQVADKGGQEVVVLPFGSVYTNAIWRVTANDAIPVCWENPSPADDSRRQHVRVSIEQTWEKHSKIRFRGWGTCVSASQGIRIRIADQGPHVKALGRYLDAMPSGMVLNFTFSKWSTSCQNDPDSCAWAVAVHEFGHALGFAHEQNRPDAPFECRAESQGTTGDWNVTTYDPQSVMNYCNTKWNNGGALSDRDIFAVRTIYGTP